MGNPFEGQIDETMAPTNLAWHYEYVKLMQRIDAEVRAFKDMDVVGEVGDLDDWVDMLSTLLSFRPATRDDIEREARNVEAQ
jgi:hypothetical protein